MTKETTTIYAIVTREDEAYRVYFRSVWISLLGVLNDQYWYIGRDFGDFLAEAQQCADWLVQCADPEARAWLRPDNRKMAGNYQGCWNAPVVYETHKVHDGGAPWGLVS